MTNGDAAYFRKRARQERARAELERDEAIALVYREMAAEYERRAAVAPVTLKVVPEI